MHFDAGERLLRSAAYTLMRRRDGFPGWRAHRREFRDLVACDGARLERLVSARLSRLLAHAFNTVPYYREVWSARGFTPGPRVTAADLRHLPILTKELIRTRKADLVSNRFDVAALDTDYTGGTVGNQTAFHRDHAAGIAKLGRQWGVLERCGYRPGDRRGLVWGAERDLNPAGLRDFKRRVRDFADAQEVLCCTTIDPSDLAEYYGRVTRFRPRVLYGYPSALYAFAEFIVEQKLPPLRVERVICTAELLTDARRRLFAEVFGGEVFNLYCSREHGCLAFECDRHEGLHIDAGSVFIEILRDGCPARPGERGEIVVTDLLNYGMPFVRYATGDLATVSDGPCGCGLALPRLHSLDGRVADALIRPDGRSVAGLMIIDIYRDLEPVREVQFVQDTPTAIDLNVVLTGELTTELHDLFVTRARELMGDVTINVHLVSDIPRNPNSGKYREVICRIGQPHGRTALEEMHV